MDIEDLGAERKPKTTSTVAGRHPHLTQRPLVPQPKPTVGERRRERGPRPPGRRRPLPPPSPRHRLRRLDGGGPVHRLSRPLQGPLLVVRGGSEGGHRVVPGVVPEGVTLRRLQGFPDRSPTCSCTVVRRRVLWTYDETPAPHGNRHIFIWNPTSTLERQLWEELGWREKSPSATGPNPQTLRVRIEMVKTYTGIVIDAMKSI